MQMIQIIKSYIYIYANSQTKRGGVCNLCSTSEQGGGRYLISYPSSGGVLWQNLI